MGETKLKYEELVLRIKAVEQENSELQNKIEFHELFNQFSNSWETFRNPEGKLIYVSPSVVNICGYHSDEFYKGKIEFLKLVHPLDLDIAKEYYKRQLEKKSFANLVCRIYDKNHNLRYLSVSSSPVYNNNKDYIGFSTSCVDVTEIKSLELAQKESEDKIRILHKLNSEMLLLNDIDSIYAFIGINLQKLYPDSIILCNSFNEKKKEVRLRHIAGLENTNLIKVIDFLGFDPVGKTYKVPQNQFDYIMSGKLVEFESGFTKFASIEVPLAVAKSIEKLIGFHKIYSIGILSNNRLLASIHFLTINKKEIKDTSFIESFVVQSGVILQKKKAEIELKISKEQLNAIVNYSPAIISVIDKSGTIIYNSAFENKLLGYNKIDRTGTNILESDFLHPDDRNSFRDFFKKVVDNPNEIDQIEFRAITADYGYVWFEAIVKNYTDNPAISGILITMKEIAKRKEAEQALKQSEEKFKQLLKNSSDIFILLDSNGTTSFVSDSSERILGYKAEELTKITTMDQMFHPEDKETALAGLKEIVEKNLAVIEYRFRHKNGNWIHLEAVGYNQLNNPFIQAIIVNVRDITKRKEAEENLRIIEEKARKNNELLSSILESPKGMIIFSLDPHYNYSAFTVSHKELMKKIWGVDIEIGMSILEIIHKDEDREKARHNFDRVLSGEHFIIIEDYGDNELFRTSWENRYSPIYNDLKEIVGLTVFVTDITIRVRAEKALRMSLEENKAMVNASSDLIFHFNRNGHILSYHASDESELLIEPERFIGQEIMKVLPPQISVPAMKAMEESIQTRKMVNFDYELFFKEEVRYYECRVIAISDEEILSFVRDITVRKLYEEKLKKLNIELHDLNATKDKLFSIIAHDLRSPFNSILGLSGLLNTMINSYEIDKSKEIAGSINQAAKNSMNLLENLLDWAKTQTGQIAFHQEKTQIESVVHEVIKILESGAALKNISINYFQSGNIFAYADQQMLKTILRNLVTNAIKFTGKGGKINVYAFEDQEFVEITVSDNGIGMGSEIKNNLFRIDQKTVYPGTQNEKGSGLGLIICKEFVEKHGGRIWVESAEEKGSEFKFTIPAYHN